MQNQINTQYLPQGNYNQCQMTPQTPVCQAPNCYPMGPSVGAVNIQIYNPTANPQGMYQPYPYNYNNMFQQQQMMPSIQPTQYENGNINPSMNQTMNLNNNQNGIAAQGDGADAKKTEDKKENRQTHQNDQDNRKANRQIWADIPGIFPWLRALFFRPVLLFRFLFCYLQRDASS